MNSTKSDPIRLLLVDDHYFVRMGLAYSIGQEQDVEIVGQAGTAQEALEEFRKLLPDVTLMDRSLPDQSGVEVIEQLRREYVGARFIMLSVDEGEEDIFRAVQAGAVGYLFKSAEREEILDAVRQVYAGNTYFPASVANQLNSRSQRQPLSAREIEVLKMVAQGLANKQIAAVLDVSEITVKVHVSSILEKLNVPDRTRAATLAIERGIIHLS